MGKKGCERPSSLLLAQRYDHLDLNYFEMVFIWAAFRNILNLPQQPRSMLMNKTCYLQSTQEEQALSLHPRNCFLPAGFNILPTFLFAAKYALLFLLFSHLQLLWFSLFYSKFYQLISANCSVRDWTQHFVFGACKISFEVFALSIFQKFLYFLWSPFPSKSNPCLLPSLPDTPPCRMQDSN